MDRFAVAERRRLLSVERQEKAKADDASMIRLTAENAALDYERGELVTPDTKRGEKRKPQRRLCGIELMERRGDITVDQRNALAMYGNDYRLAKPREARLRSCLDDTVRGTADIMPPSLSQRAANDRLTLAQYVALRGQSDLMEACNKIAGLQMTPREAAEGSARKSERMVTAVRIAADLLFRHYGLRSEKE